MTQKINFMPFTAVGFASFGGAYTKANQPATSPFQLMAFSNSLNQDVVISFDGVNDHVYLAAGQSQVLGAAFLTGDFDVAFSNGSDIWFKNAGVAPTSGKLFLERAFYS